MKLVVRCPKADRSANTLVYIGDGGTGVDKGHFSKDR